MDKKFLITYENGVYNFFSEDEVSYELALSIWRLEELQELTIPSKELSRVELTTDILINEYTTAQIDWTYLQIKEIISIKLKKNNEETFIDFTDYTYDPETHIISFTTSLEAYDTLRLTYIDVEEFYRREITSTDLKTTVLDIQTEGQSTINLPISDYVLQINNEESFVTAEGQPITYSFSVEGGQPKITLVDTTPELIPAQIRVQFSYYTSIPIVYDTSYTVTIKRNGDDPENIVKVCKSENETLYIGDYAYFMGDGDSTVDPDIIEIQEGEISTQIDGYISADERQYKISFGLYDSEHPADPAIYICEVYQIAESGTSTTPAAYVGNLSLYEDGQPDTGEPFCIITETQTAIEPGEDDIYETWLYVEDSDVQEPRSFKLSIETYNVVLVPELVGAALVSFGTKVEENGQTVLKENYGIGINSSDVGLDLPERAISLFEAVPYTPRFGEEDAPKIKLNYRGILGTLSEDLVKSLDMEGDTEPELSGIKANMAGTQGIYTDNMYIGNAEQYVAFYRDKKNNNEPRLDIKGNVYIGDETLNSVVSISNGAISLGNINGFHIYIDGNGKDSSLYEEYTYGLGFYEQPHNPYQLTGDTSVVSGKDYYSYDETTGRYIKVTPVGTENPSEEQWYDKRDKRIAYINNERLYIPRTVVLKGMELGTKWIWELQPDTNNLTLKWLGN